MNGEKRDPQEVRRELLGRIWSKPVALNDKDKELLAELVRGAEMCFANAEQLFQEASLLREQKHFSRSIFLHQISMEECAKVDMIGAAATGITMGHPVDHERLEKAFRDHKAKNFVNAYMSKVSEAELAAREANDSKAASEAFKNSQREIHKYLNAAKNSSMYVDFKDGRFIAPNDLVDEELAMQIASISYYFMMVTYPRLAPLRRMLNEPDVHSELISGFGERVKQILADKHTIDEMKAAVNSALEEMAAKIAKRTL